MIIGHRDVVKRRVRGFLCNSQLEVFLAGSAKDGLIERNADLKEGKEVRVPNSVCYRGKNRKQYTVSVKGI